MEKNLNGMNFNIDDIINIFCDFGYTLRKSEMADISYHMSQIWQVPNSSSSFLSLSYLFII